MIMCCMLSKWFSWLKVMCTCVWLVEELATTNLCSPQIPDTCLTLTTIGVCVSTYYAWSINENHWSNYYIGVDEVLMLHLPLPLSFLQHNTFQCVLAYREGGGDDSKDPVSFALFLYMDGGVQWSRGQGEDSKHALVGFSNGNDQ